MCPRTRVRGGRSLQEMVEVAAGSIAGFYNLPIGSTVVEIGRVRRRSLATSQATPVPNSAIDAGSGVGARPLYLY